jgi:hypothetical protein
VLNKLAYQVNSTGKVTVRLEQLGNVQHGAATPLAASVAGSRSRCLGSGGITSPVLPMPSASSLQSWHVVVASADTSVRVRVHSSEILISLLPLQVCQ